MCDDDDDGHLLCVSVCNFYLEKKNMILKLKAILIKFMVIFFFFGIMDKCGNNNSNKRYILSKCNIL